MPNWAVLRECDQETLQFYWFHAAAKFFNPLLSGNSGLLKKIVHADIALGASYKECWTAKFIGATFMNTRRVRVYVRQIRIPIALRLPLPFHYKTLWSICVSDCVRYGGNWMVLILEHMLTSWLLIMHGWPCLSNQAL